ncbi:MAG: HEPN domain-containing protein [Planctomycetes bacterium]|nr:HEPN domain-containing protein [Planctomycetota bacterium]
MPHDPVRVADTRAWVEKALVDFRGAEADVAASPPVIEDIFFHAQQATEKMLKAFLTWHDRPFRKTHAIEELGELCLVVDPTLRELVDRAVPLTEYASKFRYPGVMEVADLDEAKAALTVAREVFDAIAARLPAETRPSR